MSDKLLANETRLNSIRKISKEQDRKRKLNDLASNCVGIDVIGWKKVAKQYFEYEKYLKYGDNFDWIKRIKTGIGCQICGYKKSYRALHFHHINRSGKVKSISKMVLDGDERRVILSEILKCVILCANCHAELHGKEDVN